MSKTLVLDTETNGFLEAATKLHVCCTYCLETKEEWNSTDPQEIREHLSSATHLICHNIIAFDLPILKKLINWIPNDNVKITDTLILSRLGNPDRQLPHNIPKGVRVTPHSLGAWGYRVGVGKPDHEEWSVYSEAMCHRCREDVRINVLIYDILLEEVSTFGDAPALEHDIQRIIHQQEQDGVYFDTEKALEYIIDLTNKLEVIDTMLTTHLPTHCRQVGTTVTKPFNKDGTLSKRCHGWCIETMDTDHYYMSLDGHTSSYLATLDAYIAGPFSKIEWYQPDLGSDKQVKEWLLDIGWKPTVWNISKKTGERTSPKLEPESFKSLPDNIGKSLKERGTWSHRRSQIQGWLDKVRPDHCLPAGANTLGTNTGRMRHRVVVNVPKAADYVPYGNEMRSLFRARPNRVIVGHDASGIQLRMLAHYMNDAEYITQVENHDIHSYNQRLIGLETRDSAKVFIYSFLFGAGDAKLGSDVGGGKNAGTKLRNQFFLSLPKLGELIDGVKKASKRGYLIGLDGRKLMMRRGSDGKVLEHTALNVLLQGAEAVIMKRSIVMLDKAATDAGLDFIKVIDMHDESQADVLPEHADEYGILAEQSIRDAGLYYDMNVKLDAEYKVGASWRFTH